MLLVDPGVGATIKPHQFLLVKEQRNLLLATSGESEAWIVLRPISDGEVPADLPGAAGGLVAPTVLRTIPITFVSATATTTGPEMIYFDQAIEERLAFVDGVVATRELLVDAYELQSGSFDPRCSSRVRIGPISPRWTARALE
jgi:hypothetical protein